MRYYPAGSDNGFPMRGIFPAHIIIPALWLAWAGFWLVAARWAKRSRWREPSGSRALHIVPLLVSVVLLTAPRIVPAALTERFVPPGPGLPFLGILLVAAGLGFAIWARLYLGRNWSGIVTLKEEHALIRTGPYRVVRHPIYTGLLLALVGTAAAIGEWRGVLAVGCVMIGLLWKIRVEEALMAGTFPEYAEYRRRTAALIPFVY
jgi:protein-S-isoprenylcysteine O-methyltransferase Ste14